LRINLLRRTRKLVKFDNKFRSGIDGFLCGVDEAGRGPVAGPVVAAAVIFGDDAFIKGVFDSKQVIAEKREELYDEIINSAVCYGIGIVDNKEIDKINILNATKLAMSSAISKLREVPQKILADGNFFIHETAEVENIVKGDETSFSIAAASILAKVTRDRIMCEYQNTYPNFTFSMHKGYCTINHIDEILEYGYTDIHRRSFRLKAMQGELF
jgi:ribonuclease HII